MAASAMPATIKQSLIAATPGSLVRNLQNIFIEPFVGVELFVAVKPEEAIKPSGKIRPIPWGMVSGWGGSQESVCIGATASMNERKMRVWFGQLTRENAPRLVPKEIPDQCARSDQQLAHDRPSPDAVHSRTSHSNATPRDHFFKPRSRCVDVRKSRRWDCRLPYSRRAVSILQLWCILIACMSILDCIEPTLGDHGGQLHGQESEEGEEEVGEKEKEVTSQRKFLASRITSEVRGALRSVDRQQL
jgi:hypothetical protein